MTPDLWELFDAAQQGEPGPLHDHCVELGLIAPDVGLEAESAPRLARDVLQSAGIHTVAYGSGYATGAGRSGAEGLVSAGHGVADPGWHLPGTDMVAAGQARGMYSPTAGLAWGCRFDP